MRRRLVVAALAAVAGVAIVAPTTGSDAQAPEPSQTPGGPAQDVQALSQPTPCVVTQRRQERYVAAVYRREKVSLRARKEMRRMLSCAASPKAKQNMRAVQRRELGERRARRLMYCLTPTCNRRLLVYMADKRYGSGAADCLIPIIAQESGFRHNIESGGRIGPPGNRAWGLPQALPPQKMASAGADWDSNPATQYEWMFGYVDSRYGGPCGALAYKSAVGTY